MWKIIKQFMDEIIPEVIETTALVEVAETVTPVEEVVVVTTPVSVVVTPRDGGGTNTVYL